MKDKKKLKLKKFYFHPITVFIFLTVITILLSAILSALQMQGTYSKVNTANYELESVLVTVKNMLTFDGMKFIFSNALRNFLSFAPFGMLILTLIGLSVSQSTGFLDTFIERKVKKVDKRIVTFIIIFLATVSSLINDIGYVLLIPLAAIIFKANNRNPFAGIVAAFCGVSFGSAISLFVGSTEVNLIPSTTSAARLIDQNIHISLTSNLFIIVTFSVMLSIIGTIIVENIVVKRLGRYKDNQDETKTEELEILDEEEIEQERISKDKKEKIGLRYALITGIIVVIAFIYMIIPNLPSSGMLLDMSEDTYLGQLFGTNSYFQDGFTYMVSLLFILTSIAYGLGAKTIKNDKNLIYGCEKMFISSAEMVMLLFVASQFISIFRETNIGTIIATWGANILGSVSFSALPLIIVSLVLIAIANIFVTTPSSKWQIFAPVMVPAMMQANISPQFAQFILRAGDSMTAGITPLLAAFAIYIGYLNIYNKDKSKPITIHQALAYVMPYFTIISISWILLTIGWYLIGLPIGPGVYPTL